MDNAILITLYLILILCVLVGLDLAAEIFHWE